LPGVDGGDAAYDNRVARRTGGSTMRRKTELQQAAALVGLVFLVVGIAGFIPGITTDLYDGLEVAGHDGDAELLGIFEVSVLHNLVHLAFGVAAARARAHGAGRARSWSAAAPSTWSFGSTG
jgi:hypothetical protein